MIEVAERERTTARRPRAVVLVIARVVLLIGLAAQMLFAHGCHGGDVDHELFTSAVLPR